MKKKNITWSITLLTLLVFLFISPNSNAQFIHSGKIMFERKTNLKLQMRSEEQDYSWLKSLGLSLPESISSYFILKFENQRSKYYFEKSEDIQNMSFFNRGPARENTVVIDFNSSTIFAQKDIFESQFLIEDSLITPIWKLEDEMREIAGFMCRKAITIIDDSVVVVAFYTDQIIQSSGPESFNGLPGMILGIAIPRLYTTWFATEVNVLLPDEKDFTPPKRGRNVNYQTFQETINKSQNLSRNRTSIWWMSL